jgi:23S rRNA (cytosine1962-C5)-methyltransferase
MNQSPAIVLRPGRNKSVIQHHPWIFSGSVNQITGSPGIGETVAVYDDKHELLGWAAYSPSSNIRARMWTFNPDEEVNLNFINQRISNSIEFRKQAFGIKTPEAYRLIYAESDGLPGVIVDKYHDHLVLQVLSAGAERWKSQIIDSLVSQLQPKSIFERSDVEVRKLEGLPEFKGLLYGEKPEQNLEITENTLKFNIDIENGQKTGFYLDQRSNRNEILAYAEQNEVLNCFAFTGGFSVYALKAKAKHVTSIDSSADVIDQAKKNVELNDLPLEKTEWIIGDVFQELRKFRDQNRKFDLIILDPPKFAPTQAQVEKASRGYKDINLLAFKLLRKGGVLFTFSCSGGVSPDLFQKIVASAALDAGVDAQILKYLSQDVDHPVSLNFPESMYLKGLICRIN